jgi:hypothetical protein
VRWKALVQLEGISSTNVVFNDFFVFCMTCSPYYMHVLDDAWPRVCTTTVLILLCVFSITHKLLDAWDTFYRVWRTDVDDEQGGESD